jgi:hypothetical protein
MQEAAHRSRHNSYGMSHGAAAREGQHRNEGEKDHFHGRI